MLDRTAELCPAPLIRVTGVIKWFKSENGFGFIKQDDGGPDVLLLISCLRRAGYSRALKGATVSCEAQRGPKGLCCARILSMDESTALRPKPAAHAIPPRIVKRVFGPERMMVKNFNSVSGFGFFTSPDKPDVFVHKETLHIRDTHNLVEGEMKMVIYGVNEADPLRRFMATDVLPDIGAT
jgi:CspA family cold shock protein